MRRLVELGLLLVACGAREQGVEGLDVERWI